MTSLDFTPLFRSTVGFDRLSRMLEASLDSDMNASSYPPYNIVKLDDDHYQITMAVAGFTESELDVTSQDNQLLVSGRLAQHADGDKREFLHRGIAERAFERRFQLADHIHVTGADLQHGLLTVSLERDIPEAMKPRKIQIASGKSKGLLGQ